ncbi:NACHT domain-containing protein [Anabaena sp. UHCC 0253]|uniref:NB-ARC domain-containing protein n=1 Tax=Anabaena sp. UHCC 0253 TaxID=2590019 RepID=UPI001444C8F3|nr:NB-ARC domain-containing protein [Anabaena sp. UHCC 0253]MTJ53125.1 NACHT domain-containing protein [Anabaena sp. UHCC 0253]
MSNSLKASPTGLEIVDKARQRLGWTKTSTARWWQDAHTSKATLRRFWQGDHIQKEIFIAICQAVGISNWETITDLTDINTDNSTPYIDWDEAPNVESFYGRNQELLKLDKWIKNGCKLINITGIAGIGKTSLVLALVDQIQSQFNCLIWKSIDNIFSVSDLLANLLNQFNLPLTADINAASYQIINYLQKHRCLIVLDGIDNISENLELNKFIQQLSLHRHQSCIITTSRKKQNNTEINPKIVANLALNGLSKTEALELLNSRGFTGKELGISALIQLYRGNPLGLKLVTPLIQSMFSGNVAAFINQNTLIVGDRLRIVLKQQLENLSELEQEIIYWLAIWQEPISFARLQTHLIVSIDPAKVFTEIIELEQKSLLEKWVNDYEPSFTLQPLIMKIVTDELVENATHEIKNCTENQDISYLKILRNHWLLRPGTDDIAGEKIIKQLRESLFRIYGANLPQILKQILLLLDNKSPLVIGYIGCNVIALENFN